MMFMDIVVGVVRCRCLSSDIGWLALPLACYRLLATVELYRI